MKNKAGGKAAQEIFRPGINSGASEFPMSAAIKACQIKSDTREAERNIQIISQICFPEPDGSERLLSSLTALTIN